MVGVSLGMTLIIVKVELECDVAPYCGINYKLIIILKYRMFQEAIVCL